LKAARAPRAESQGALPFSGSYDPEDVTFLLTPIQLALTDIAEKERQIQSGRHYSEMLSPESAPGPEYMRLFEDALARNGERLARDVAALAAALAVRAGGRAEVVVASLARAGTPIGVLLRRALVRLGVRAPHYSISVIRDRGVDLAALKHMAARHDGRDVVFVDGWTGKGVIARELRASEAGPILGAAPFLAVVADPAGAADLAATEEDYVIPSGLLNGVASGLVSRSIYDASLVGTGAFHGVVVLTALARRDLSRDLVARIDGLAPSTPVPPAAWPSGRRETAAKLSAESLAAVTSAVGVSDSSRVKPGIAEATRALLRRVPDRLLVTDPGDPDVAHLLHLAAQRGVGVELMPRGAYKAVAVIRSLGALETSDVRPCMSARAGRQ
jgi:hypothetical protein